MIHLPSPPAMAAAVTPPAPKTPDDLPDFTPDYEHGIEHDAIKKLRTLGVKKELVSLERLTR